MQTKIFEIRDRVTCLIVSASKFISDSYEETCMLLKNGWGHSHEEQEEYMFMQILSDGLSRSTLIKSIREAHDRTLLVAYYIINREFKLLNSCDVIVYCLLSSNKESNVFFSQSVVC